MILVIGIKKWIQPEISLATQEDDNIPFGDILDDKYKSET